jgi:hypothetical protein
MGVTALKNTLLACGAYYVAMWLYGPLVWLWSFVSNRLTFTGGIETIVLMPIVMGVPEMLVACGAGVAVVATVDAKHPSRWALLPAGLFLMQHAFARRWWARSPTFEDQVAIVVEAALPAVACILAATVLESRVRRTPPDRALHPTAAVDGPNGRG